jgi:NAD(P)-dependent dehydrogenase (short-subunit alcohol dehydrogenase family)
MREKVRLHGQVAVVTGAGRGIGRATAVTLAQAGADLSVAARTAADIEETARQVREQGSSALVVPADVSDWSAMQELEEKTFESLGPTDIVVVNAGTMQPVGETWEVSPSSWAESLRINLIGAFFTVRAFLPRMIGQRSGVIILVSSGAAGHPVPGWSAYCAAKAGLDHFARNVAAELDERNLPIRIHTLYPGVVATSMQRRIRNLSAEEFPRVEKYRDYHEKEILRPPEEPAKLIWWLATPLAAEFHGQVVDIDDEAIRNRVAAGLGVSKFGGRE